jgi:hypothetical protein
MLSNDAFRLGQDNACSMQLLLSLDGTVPIVEAQIPTPLWGVDPLLFPTSSHFVKNLHIAVVERDHLQIVGDALLSD